MQENKNNCCGSNGNGSNSVNTATIIDTSRVLDTCKDRDCYEDTRVYLTATDEQNLENYTNIRTKGAKILGAYVGLNEVPFNCGFYQVKVKYYVEVEFESCAGAARNQTFKGLSILEKDVVLYGGEGRALSFYSGNGTYCNPCIDCGTGNDPTAIAETVDPVVLGTKVSDCNCPCSCTCNEYVDIPEEISNLFGEELVVNTTGPKILVSFGVFSVIRIVRSAQLLINATDYSVPDKECNRGTNNDNPCELFRTMDFPVGQFRGAERNISFHQNKGGSSGCGCKG